MSLSVEEKPGNHYRVRIGRRFTFDIYRHFFDAINALLPSSKGVTFDLAQTVYMDNAGLGMLLLAKDRLPHDNTSIMVTEGSHVHDLIETVNFGRLFDIELVKPSGSDQI